MAIINAPRTSMRTGSVLTCLLSVVLLSACGGGASGADASTTAAPEAKAVLAAVVGGSATGDPETWTLCAVEGQTCLFTGTRRIRYGTDTNNVVIVLTSQTSCSNGVFGDPAYGIGKSCWYSSQAMAPAPADAWTTCASESQFCAFSGTRTVRYGTDTNFYTGVYTNGVSCTNGVFGDPAYGIGKTCRYAETAVAADPVPVDPVGSSGQAPPIVFNASSSAHAGDVVSLQGEGFGASPRVYLDGAPAAPLEILNQVGGNWLAVQIPASAQGALVIRVNNGTGTSARVLLNAAKPLHLDATQLVAGGAFRVFGRSLFVAGKVPTITIDGAAASIDLARSDEYMLSAVAPLELSVTAAAAVVVDNGNGSGPARLDRTIEVVASGSGDPFSLGVGWAAAFTPIARTTVFAASDSRLSQPMVCDGTHDDTPAMRAAVELVVSGGGGIVRLPQGRCRMSGTLDLKSRVVVQGAGKDATELVYESNYPVYGTKLDLTGISDLTLTNAGSSTEGALLKDNTRLFIRNVRVRLNTSRQMYLTGNRHFVIANSDFVQTGSIGDQGPYVLNDSAGLVFEGNTTQWINGASAFGRVHDSYVHANRFTRDGRGQNSSGAVHSLTMDFAYRIAVVGNTFDVVNGPITNRTRNDGETLLTEGGGAVRTENLGTVASATTTTLSDPSNTFQLDPFGTGTTPENYGVAIVGGKGTGQTRRVVSGSGTTLNIDRAWEVVPDDSSHYATFVWGLEKSLIKDNVLSQNPRGIWLYHTAIREVDVVGNSITEGGGIYLRSYQNLSTRSFMPIYGVLIARNTVSNTTGQWMSYINAVFVNSDARPFGVAMLGIEMRSNDVTANRPALSSNLEEYASLEGFLNMMRVESYATYDGTGLPHLLGTILTSNSCTNCEVAVRIGTGAGGTTILSTRATNTGALTADWATTSTGEKSTGTVIR